MKPTFLSFCLDLSQFSDGGLASSGHFDHDLAALLHLVPFFLFEVESANIVQLLRHCVYSAENNHFIVV